MNRRQFLTLATVFTAAGMTQLGTPRLAAARGPVRIPRRQILYRGTQDGKLYRSTNGGRTWHLMANFGNHCAIDQVVSQRRGGTTVKLVCAGHNFELNSKDDRVWRTAERRSS